MNEEENGAVAEGMAAVESTLQQWLRELRVSGPLEIAIETVREVAHGRVIVTCAWVGVALILITVVIRVVRSHRKGRQRNRVIIDLEAQAINTEE